MRRIKSAQIKYLTLCKRGKNRMPVLYKAEGQDGDESGVVFQTIIKATDGFEENGELLAVAYANEWRDTDGHIADQSVCKEMAYSFMREGGNLDMRHDGKTIEKSRAYVAENFLIQKGDPRFENFKDYNDNVVDVTGSWGVLIKIEDKELRKLYKEDGWNGVSIQGLAELEVDETPEAVKKAMVFYKAYLDNQGDDDLKPEELAKALADNNAALAGVIVEGITKAQKPPEARAIEPVAKKEDDKPVFKGDITKSAEVKAFAKEVRIYNLKKTVDFADPKSIDNFAKQLAEIEKSDEEESDDDEEVREARRVIAKAEGRSDVQHARENAPASSKSKVPEAFRGMALSKEEIEGFEVANRMSKHLNDRNGTSKK